MLKALEEDDLVKLLENALKNPDGFGNQNVDISPENLRAIAAFANGDARTALNTLEMAALNGEISAKGITVTTEGLSQCISRKSLLYDKTGEEHYNLISALHKSMRNSDPDAAIYWMMRMLEGGENPLYIARRLIRFAAKMWEWQTVMHCRWQWQPIRHAIFSGCLSVTFTSPMRLYICQWRPSPMPFIQPVKPPKRM